MRVKHLILALVAGLSLLAAGCGQVSTVVPEVPPEQVVADFYADYLEDAGTIEGELVNRLLESGYRTSPFLADIYVIELDEMLSTGMLVGDPLLCAQDIPERVEAVSASISGRRANVVVHKYFAGNPVPSDHTVILNIVGDKWLIRRVVCQ